MSATAPNLLRSPSPLAHDWTVEELKRIVFRVWPDLEGEPLAGWINRCLFVAAVLRGEEDIYTPEENRRIRETAKAMFPDRVKP